MTRYVKTSLIRDIICSMEKDAVQVLHDTLIEFTESYHNPIPMFLHDAITSIVVNEPEQIQYDLAQDLLLLLAASGCSDAYLFFQNPTIEYHDTVAKARDKVFSGGKFRFSRTKRSKKYVRLTRQLHEIDTKSSTVVALTTIISR